jgi:hypothetical protein
VLHAACYASHASSNSKVIVIEVRNEVGDYWSEGSFFRIFSGLKPIRFGKNLIGFKKIQTNLFINIFQKNELTLEMPNQNLFNRK